MGKYVERAAQLRSEYPPKYNCAQAVLIPFAEEMGMSEEQAKAMTANFGGGMRVAGTCGSVTGGLMALGLLGFDSPKDASSFYRTMEQTFGGTVKCSELLKAAVERGEVKFDHCNRMILTAVELIEQKLEDR